MKTSNIFKYTVIIAIATFWSLKSYAQQDPQFTQYMYNMSVINPAYATADEGILNLGALYRTQWVGVEGAPRTASLFARTPINEKIELGLSFTNDNIGDVVEENNIYADFAYVLQVSENSNLSLGLKAGLTLFNTNFDGFVLQSGGTNTDIAFNENINKAFPNVGLGAFYFSDNYYIGLSAPNLLASKHLETENGVRALGAQNTHFFLTGGYVFDITPDIKFKPAFMAKGVSGAPLSVDLTANVLLQEKLEVGLAYRLEDAVSALVNFRIAPNLRIGYSYDYTTSNLSDFSSGSHEIMLLFDIDLFNLKTGYDRSPRFF